MDYDTYKKYQVVEAIQKIIDHINSNNTDLKDYEKDDLKTYLWTIEKEILK
jgi:hypothetical protein